MRAFRQLSHCARKQKRESRHHAERRTAIPETSKKLRTHSKRQNYSLGFDSERLTRLCGTGVPFRPLFAPIPSCNVPGVKILPTTRAEPPTRLLLGQTTPNESQSIGYKFRCVKSDSQQPEENSRSILHYVTANAMRCGKEGFRYFFSV